MAVGGEHRPQRAPQTAGMVVVVLGVVVVVVVVAVLVVVAGVGVVVLVSGGLSGVRVIVIAPAVRPARRPTPPAWKSASASSRPTWSSSAR